MIVSCVKPPVLETMEYVQGASVSASYVCRSSQVVCAAVPGAWVPFVTQRITGRPAESPRVSSLVQVAVTTLESPTRTRTRAACGA